MTAVIERKNNGRLEYVDALRGFGIVLMIAGHVGFGQIFDIYIHSFHMPLFFFISGFLFNESNKEIGIKRFVLKKTKSFIVPYLFFGIIDFVILYIVSRKFSIQNIMITFLYSNHNNFPISGALWFLFCLYIVEIIFFLLRTKLSDTRLALVIAITAIVGNILPVQLPLSLDTAMVGLGLFGVGYFLRHYNNKASINFLFNMNIFWLLIFFVFNTILIFINGYVNIRLCSYSIIPLFWINSIVAFLCYFNLFYKIEVINNKLIKTINNWLKDIGRNSIIFVCLNQIVLLILNKIATICSLININFFLLHLIILIAALSCLKIASVIINRTKLRVLIGKSENTFPL